MFVACAELALLVASRRWRPVAVSALGVEAALLPSQVWTAIHHLHSDTTNAVHVFGRSPATA